MLRPVLYWLVGWLVGSLVGCYFVWLFIHKKKSEFSIFAKKQLIFPKILIWEIIRMVATIMLLYCRSFYLATVISCALMRYHSL